MALELPSLKRRNSALVCAHGRCSMGRVELATASVNGARIVTDGIGTGGGDWAATIRDDRGLIDPDKVTVATFTALDRFVAAVRSGSTREVRFEDVTIAASELPFSAADPFSSLPRSPRQAMRLHWRAGRLSTAQLFFRGSRRRQVRGGSQTRSVELNTVTATRGRRSEL